MKLRLRTALFAAAVLSCAPCLSCGGAKPPSAQSPTAGGWSADQIDADPMALLPPSALATANVDARAFFSSDAVGSQTSMLAEQIVPIAEASGFTPSRDVDRVVLGAYGAQGADVAAVLVGRFDPDKVAKAVAEERLARAGLPVATADYAGRKIYTVKTIGITVLTSKTVIVGSDAGIRRVLDRIKDGSPKRELTPWMIEALDTKGAAAAFAADFTTQPLSQGAQVSVGGLPLPWLKTMKTARGAAELAAPGLKVAGTLAFADAAGATRAADGIRGIARLASMAAAFGAVPKIQSLAVATVESNVELSFAIDDAGMRKLLALGSQLVH